MHHVSFWNRWAQEMKLFYQSPPKIFQNSAGVSVSPASFTSRDKCYSVSSSSKQNQKWLFGCSQEFLSRKVPINSAYNKKQLVTCLHYTSMQIYGKQGKWELFVIAHFWSAYWRHCMFATLHVMFSSGLPSTREIERYWRESSEGPLRQWRDWNISYIRKGWESWDRLA